MDGCNKFDNAFVLAAALRATGYRKQKIQELVRSCLPLIRTFQKSSKAAILRLAKPQGGNYLNQKATQWVASRNRKKTLRPPRTFDFAQGKLFSTISFHNKENQPHVQNSFGSAI